MSKYILFAIVVMLMTSCITIKKCADKFGTGATHQIDVSDSVTADFDVIIAGDSATGKVPCDELKPGDSVKQLNSNGNLEVIFWRDKFDSLKHSHVKRPDVHYRAQKKPDTIKVKEKVFIKVKADCPDTVILDPEKGAPLWHRWLNGYKNFSAFALLLLIIIFLVYLKMKR